MILIHHKWLYSAASERRESWEMGQKMLCVLNNGVSAGIFGFLWITEPDWCIN